VCENVEKSVEKLTNRSNPISKHVKKLGTDRSYREGHKQFLCDGEKLLNEALAAGVEIEIVITSKQLEQDFPQETRVFHATNDLIDSLSPLKNSQGLLFTCKIPQPGDCDFLTGTHILLDNIRDPGNVGTIIRTANAFGIKSIILTENSADIYNPKTIRATMGAIFKQNIFIMNLEEINKLKQAGAHFTGTSNDISSDDITKVNITNSIIIFGNEGQGISEELLYLCNLMVRIPLSDGCESLNVAIAAAIIMWELKT